MKSGDPMVWESAVWKTTKVTAMAPEVWKSIVWKTIKVPMVWSIEHVRISSNPSPHLAATHQIHSNPASIQAYMPPDLQDWSLLFQISIYRGCSPVFKVATGAHGFSDLAFGDP